MKFGSKVIESADAGDMTNEARMRVLKRIVGFREIIISLQRDRIHTRK